MLDDDGLNGEIKCPARKYSRTVVGSEAGRQQTTGGMTVYCKINDPIINIITK